MWKNIGLWLQKYSRREFRPGYIFDIPVYAYFTYLACRAKHLGFFSNINPGMILSGFAGYSKYDDIDKFDQKLLPISIFIQDGHDHEYIEHQMKQNNIHYPCIAKPTLGRT
jgi:carbamoylphosphate synthase large subunit